MEFFLQRWQGLDENVTYDCQAAGVNFIQCILGSVPVRVLHVEVNDVAGGAAVSELRRKEALDSRFVAGDWQG